MREIGVRELKAGLSAALRSVVHGERIRITRHGRAIAEIGPPVETKSIDQQVDWLIAEGRLTSAADPIDRTSPTPLRTGKSASEIVLADREAER